MTWGKFWTSRVWGQRGVEWRWSYKGLRVLGTLKLWAKRRQIIWGDLLKISSRIRGSSCFSLDQEKFGKPGKVWRHLWLLQWGEGATSIWVEAKHALTTLQCVGQASSRRNYLAQELKRPCFCPFIGTSLCSQFLLQPPRQPPWGVKLILTVQVSEMSQRQDVSFTTDVTVYLLILRETMENC
jgi:hypothetical protein